jgi:exosome complex RNA-binding protein Rrp42 (RNase PH superfamily)
MNFSQPYDDKEVRRTNPKRNDPRTDWTLMNNEKGHDSDVANRFEGMAMSVLLASIDKMCVDPSAKELTSFQNFIHTASDETRSVVLAYVQEQLDVLEWNRTHMVTTAGIRFLVMDGAIRHYILSHIFG